MRFYNVSWMATRRDNGACATFLARAEAEQCLAQLEADGVYYAVLWAC